MGWKGMAIGGYLGSLFGGPLGAILGAVLGHKVENAAFGTKRKVAYEGMSSRTRSLVFCGAAAAMLAKMAKADGCVSRSEIARIEAAFERLGFSPKAREYAVGVFRKAKDDSHSIYDYAAEFAAAVQAVEVRELLYELLWEVAVADGEIAKQELLILQRIPRALEIRIDWYAYYHSRFVSGGTSNASRDPLADAYAAIGASASDDDETLKRKYRELAKRNHPDALRAQGLPEEMIGKATERMSRINAAWAQIRQARGI